MNNIYMFLYRIRTPLEIQLMNKILFGSHGTENKDCFGLSPK